MTWIQTLGGRRFDLLKPDPAAIDPAELATALSRMCRFGGHCTQFYSVAEHSRRVYELVRELNPENRSLWLPALLHDAHEAYWGFGDILHPAKQIGSVVFRATLEHHAEAIDAAVAQRFGFDPELFRHPAIHHADKVLLATERRDLMRPCADAWDPLPDPLPTTILPRDVITASADFLQGVWSFV